MKVSWMVTGIRHDAWAEAHRIPVEEEKPANEQGHYLSPELFGAPPEKGISARHGTPVSAPAVDDSAGSHVAAADRIALHSKPFSTSTPSAARPLSTSGEN